MVEDMVALDIIKMIEEKNFVIYGNGYIAKRFFHQIQKMGCESHVKAIAVTNSSLETVGVNGQSVCCIEDIDINSLIFVATHDEVAKEMFSILKKLGFEKVICVYPYLFDMELGEPIERDILVNVDKLFDSLQHGCVPAIYYLTLCDYCGENVYNGKLYIKVGMYFATEDTAKKRWSRFKNVIDKYMKDGFHQDFNIKICKDFSLLDGMHRLTIAKFFGIKELKADMYNCDGGFYTDENLGMSVCIHEEDLAKYYTDDEIEAIKLVHSELIG